MKPRIFSTTRLSLPLAAALAALFSASSVSATPVTWTGATDGTWNTLTNWSGGSVPLVTNDLTILGPLNVAGALNIDFNANNAARSLIFTNTAATSITNTTSGANRTLTLGSGGITTGAGAVQIGSGVADQAVNVTLGTAQTWNIGAGGLTVSNDIAGASTGITKTGSGNLIINRGAATTFTGGLNVNGGTVTLDYSNFNGNQLLSSSNALTIGSSGTFSLVGNNTAAAANIQTFASTTLNAGRNNVIIAKGASGASVTLNLGALTVNPGSVTAFSPTTAWTTTASTTERVFITAGGSVPTLPGSGSQFINGVFYRGSAAAGQARWAAVNSSGQLLAGAALTNLAAGSLSTPLAPVQFSGTSSIALTNTSLSTYGLLLNTGSGGLTLTLADSGTYTLNSIIQQQSANGVTIAPGALASNIIIGSERNLVLNMDNSAGLTINAPIANNGGGASSVTIASTAPSGTTPGNIVFGGANTYTGATYIAQGTLTLTNVNALSGNNPGVNGTSRIFLGGGSAATLSTSTNGITISAPITTANTGVASTISFAVTTSGGSIALNGAIGGNGNVAYTTPNVSSGGNTNTINLGAAGTYAGSTTINTGNINNNLVLRNTSAAANVLPTSTVLTFGTGAGTLTSARTTTFDLNGQNQTLAGLGSLAAVAVPNGRNHRVTSTAAATLTINSTADQTFGGTTLAGTPTPYTTNAQIAGAISLVKSGAGTFTLGGLLTGVGATASGNTFTGSTTVLGGILVLGETRSIQNSAFDTTGSITGNTNNGLRTTVTTLTLGGLTGSNDFSTRFTSTTGGYTGLTALTLNPGTGVTNSYSADIGDGAIGMTLTKSGAGTQVLNAANTHKGTTTVTAGILSLGNSAALQNSAFDTAASIAGDATNGLRTTVTTLTLGGLTGGNDFATRFTSTTGGYTGLTALALNPGTGVTHSYAGDIGDGATGMNLTKNGAGTQVLTGTNNHTGTTSVSAGKLLVEGSIAASAVTVSGTGTILATDASATVGNSLIIQSGAILAVGDAGNATTATATVTNATTFNNSSIFSWDINAAGTSYDKLVTSDVLGEGAAGDAVFRIVAADATFANTFWDIDRTWTDIFTTNGSNPISGWASVFGSNVSVVNSSFNTITPVDGAFSLSGSTLTWTAVPEPTSALAGILLASGLLRRRRA